MTISSSYFVIRQIHNGYAVNNDSADCQTDSYYCEQLQPGNFLLQIFAAVAPEAGDGEDFVDYITVVFKDDNYKLNIGDVIKKESLNVKKSVAY